MKRYALLLALAASPAPAADLGLGFGYFSLPIGGLGILGHVPLRSDLTLEIALYRGVYDAKYLLHEGQDDSINVDRFQVTGALDTIGVQYFLGEHFFTGLAVGRRRIVFDLQVNNSIDTLQEKLEAQSNVVKVSIGHSWVFDNGVFITGEWAAFAIPVTSQVNTAITTQGAVSDRIEEVETDALHQAELIAHRTTFGMTAQVGWRF